MSFVKRLYREIFKPELQLIFPPKAVIAAIAALSVLASLIIPFTLLPWPLALALALVLLVLSAALLVVLVEIWFRLAHKKVYGFPREMILPEHPDYQRFIYESHPCLTYVRKRDFALPGHKEHTNSLRATCAPGQARETLLPKPPDVARIACLGASEAAFYEEVDGRSASFPDLLRKRLQKALPRVKVEMLNFSTPGYTSAEMMVEFMLNSVQCEPDVVMLYNGYNDVRAFLTPGFRHDYSHFRRNLAQEQERMRLSGLVPLFPLHFYNFLLWQALEVPPPTRTVAGDVHYGVTVGKMDVEAHPVGLEIFRRNIEHIINVCQARGIYLVLSTFCHYFDEHARSNPNRLKWENKVRQVVEMENQVLRDLAQEYGLVLVDNFNLIPQEAGYFLDKVHFTPQGMKLIAANLAGPIQDHLAAKFSEEIT